MGVTELKRQLEKVLNTSHILIIASNSIIYNANHIIWHLFIVPGYLLLSRAVIF